MLPTRHGPLTRREPARIGPTWTDTDRGESNTDRRISTRWTKGSNTERQIPTRAAETPNTDRPIPTRTGEAPTWTGKSQHAGARGPNTDREIPTCGATVKSDEGWHCASRAAHVSIHLPGVYNCQPRPMVKKPRPQPWAQSGSW